MTKNLVAIGNSLGIIIEKPILDLLKISRETPLEVRTDGERLIIEPADSTDDETRFQTALDRTMKNHKETFRKLAQ